MVDDIKFKTPSYEEAEECISLRVQSKTGRSLNEKEMSFIKKMLKKYPEWYRNTNDRVFKESAPFGSQIGK